MKTWFYAFGSAHDCCFGFCYGCDKSDCLNVCLTGALMSITAPCIVGWVFSCCAGLKLLGVK